MSKDKQAQQDTQSKTRVNKPVQEAMRGVETAVSTPFPALQRAYAEPRTLSPAQAKTLQRTIGNQALGRLTIQRKMTVGPVGDKYEQEADAVAKQVVSKLQATSMHTAPAQTAQRQEEKELQMKSLVQRQEEEELQMKPLPIISSLQRQEEEELQMKPLVQRQEEEELQAKSKTTKGDPMLAGGELSGDVESSVQSAKSGGQPISDNIRGPMEQAFNADFSSVKVHTGSQSDNLNRSLSARAFTSGNDVFFRQGEYNPSSTAGQELLAHELTHVVQQRGTAVQRQPSHPISSATSGSTLQRDLDPKVERALLAASERNPDILRVSPINNILESLRGKGNDGKDIIPLKMQREITHLWSKGQKNRRGNDEELTTRLDYARASLIKVFMEEFITSMMQGEHRKAARKSAFKLTMTLRKEMVNWGLAKAGAIRPELNFLLTAIDAPIGDETAVNVGPRIEVRGTTIPGGGFPGKWHSFVVYTDATGKQFYIASHQAGEGDNEGLLQARIGDYAPGIHEWAPDADTKVLEEGPTADDKWPLLKDAAEAINAVQLPYELLSVNCNRAAYHILRQAGVETIKPPAAGYPGWGTMLF